ncbi:MAG: hypothetical protein A2Y25_01230 [Candidatus Melainabacteria bacterium GWF2_37_15]|nr:MAG: hypothetical protein A2Y25_01230 [Candidatus Melainabacteria bacterium GWF2_37_15]
MSDISYDHSDKRKYYRLINPVKVTIEGQDYKTLDWSVSALKIANYSGFLGITDETLAEIEINFQGFSVKFSQKIKVMRIEQESNTLVAEYIDPSPRNREILEYFSKGLITGQFQPFDEIIKHIDIPISDDYINASFQEDSEYNTRLPNKKLILFMYVVLGVMVFMYIFQLAYTKAYLIQVESAVVASRTETLNSPTKGVVIDIFAQEGETIAAGEPIFKVIDPAFEREIEDKKIEILKNEALLKEKQKQLETSANVGKIAFLRDELEKKTQLYEKKLVSRPEIDTLTGEILQLENDLALLQAEEERLEEIIAISEKDLAFSESINTHNTVKAPFDAIVEEVLAFKGKYVDEKTPVVLIKSNSHDKFIEAYLKESQPHKLMLNSRVYIEIPLYSLKLEGILTEIQKNNELATAIIKPNDPDLLETVKLGTPAKISFVKGRFFNHRTEELQEDTSRPWDDEALTKPKPKHKPKKIKTKKAPSVKKKPKIKAKPAKPDIIQKRVEYILKTPASLREVNTNAYNTAFLGLCYEKKADKQCLEQAKIRLLEAIKINKPTGHPINETNLDGFVFGYNFIKQEFTEEEKNTILAWFSEMREKHEKWKFGPTSGINNWKTHNLKMLLLLDRALEDEESFNKHIEEAKQHYQKNIINEITGESYDYSQKGNSLHYHTYNLESWLEIALLSNEFKDMVQPQFNFLRQHLKAGETAKISRAVYSYYTLFPDEKDPELLEIANKSRSVKFDFLRIRASIYD